MWVFRHATLYIGTILARGLLDIFYKELANLLILGQVCRLQTNFPTYKRERPSSSSLRNGWSMCTQLVLDRQIRVSKHHLNAYKTSTDRGESGFPELDHSHLDQNLVFVKKI